MSRRIGDEPPGVAEEWYSDEGIKLRYNWPNLVKADLSEVPGWLRDIVAVAREEGWIVVRSGQPLVLYTPDGLNYETIECTEPGLTQGLVRHAVLRRLQRLGLPMHHGSRGQSLPGREKSVAVLPGPDKTSAGSGS